MKIKFEAFTNEIDELVELLTASTWTFHGVSNPEAENIRKYYKNGLYSSDESQAFWIILDTDVNTDVSADTNAGAKIGMLRIYDLEDDCPLFDIRISDQFKGLGIGKTAIQWMVNYVFTDLSGKTRIEGHTREDNFAMRTVFHKSGFVKEAHHRKAWPSSDGNIYDSIGYGITKEDWQSGVVTPVNWNDFKY